jgi:hypothetical protein
MKTSLTAAALLLTLCAAAHAQDGASRRRINAQASVEGKRFSPNREARMRLLGIDSDGEYAGLHSQAVFDKAPSRPAGHLSRFTRVAGMFMGRVSAISVGPFKVCLELDIR